MAGCGIFLGNGEEGRDLLDLPRALKGIIEDWPGHLKAVQSKKVRVRIRIGLGLGLG